MTKEEIIQLVRLQELRPPYDDEDFIRLLESNSSLKIASNEKQQLAVLVQEELAYLYPSEYGFSYGRHLISISNWVFNGYTAVILEEFERLCELGLPVLPAFQRVLQIVSNQVLHGNTPIGDISFSSLRSQRSQLSALHLASRLIVYLGYSQELALHAASERVKQDFPDAVGVSPERLKKLLQSRKYILEEARNERSRDEHHGVIDTMIEDLKLSIRAKG
jgi:hypothetical protein